MRVAHLCSRFSPLSQTFIYDYVTELERRGVEGHVLTQGREHVEARPFPRVTIIPKPGLFNAQRLRYRLLEVIGQRERGTSSQAVLRARLRTALRQLRPDLVHAHFGPMGVLAAPVAHALEIPLIVSFYGYDVSKLVQKERWRRAYRALWPAADAVVMLSETMKAEAQPLGCPADKIHVVHLGRDLERFAYHPPDGRVRRLVSVGRLVEKKGHGDALAAMEELRREGRDMHLRIIGGGPLRDELAAQIQALGLEGVAELAGSLPNERVAQELRAADAFLLCSKTASDGDREGTPTVLVEAQAVGLPCVSTRHAGIPEMIPEENHRLLANEGDVKGLAERIERLGSCPPPDLRAIAEAGRRKVEADFNLEREAEKLQAVYGSVLAA